jgi:hypothetical protein
MRILLLILSTSVALAQTTVATFTLKELYGSSHFEQPIEFTFGGGYKTPASHRVLGPNGQEVPFQQLSNGNILVESNLPASTLQLTFGCSLATGNAIQIYGAFTNLQLQPSLQPTLLQLNYLGAAPIGITNGGFYYIKTYDGETAYATLSSTFGGSTITLSSAGSGACTAIKTGWTADPATDTFTQVGHNYANGNRWACSTSGTAPAGLICDGATAYYVINATADTFKVSTSIGGAAVNITSAGTGVPQSVIDWTWTLQSGVASANLSPSNPVSLKKNGGNWEMTNGLTGIRIPTTAGNGIPYDLSPIQGIKLADGTWVATGPNYFYEISADDPGSLINATQETRAYNITGYNAIVLEVNPLLTTILVSYTFNRPNYVYGGTINLPAGTGHFTEKITMYANQPVAYFERNSDMRFQYFVNVYPGLTDKPDVYRWRGGSATTATCGHNFDSSSYGGVNTVINTPAYRDLDYTQNVQVGTACTATTYKRLDPLISYSGDDGGWYQMMYKTSGSTSSPLIGIFVGRLGVQTTPIGTGTGTLNTPGFFTSNNHFTTGATAGGIHLQQNIWTGATDPTTTYALYVSTKANLAADGVQQPIQRTMNLISGINLTSLHSYALSFSDPSGGWKSPYLADSALAAVVAKVRDGTSSCGSTDCFYNKISYTASPILAMWRANSAAGIDTALNSVLIPLNYLAFAMTQGDGATRDAHLPFSNSSVVWSPASSLMAMILVDSNLTAAQKLQVKSYLAVLASMEWDNDYIPLDNGAGFGLGTANQVVQMVQLRATFAALLPSHPLMTTKQAQARSTTLSQIASVTNQYGALEGSTWYHGAAHEPVVSNLLALRTIGQFLFADAPTLLSNTKADLAVLTPPEPRFGNIRKSKSDGDGNTAANARLAMDGTAFNGTDTTTAQHAMWGWNSTSSAAYTTEDVSVVPTFIQIDDSITQTNPALTSSAFPGGFSHHRHDWGTGNETALWFINGDFYNDHRHCDQGQVSIYAHSAPLAIDWNANLYNPETAGCFAHNAVVFDADIGQSWSADSPPLTAGGLTNSFVASAQTDFSAFSMVTRSAAAFTAADGTVWTRTVISAAPNASYPVISTKDSFSGARAINAKTLTWNLMASGAVVTPAGNITPNTRSAATCAADQLPSNGTVNNLGSGLQHWNFPGASWTAHATGGVNWDLYTLSSVTTQQFILGAWGHKCHNGRESFEFSTVNGRTFDEIQDILRVHDTGPFQTYILPYRKGETPTRTVTTQTCGLQVAQGGETSCLSDTQFTYTNGTANVLAAFDTGSHTAFSMTVSGGAIELVRNGTTVTAKISGITAGTRIIDLSGLGGSWGADKPVGFIGTNIFTLYHPGGAQPGVYTVTFSATAAATRIVTITLKNAAAGSVQYRFGSATEFVGKAACSITCSFTVLAPTGTHSFSYDYLNGAGAVLSSSGVSNIVL